MKPLKIIKEMFFPSGIKCIFCDGEIEKENRYCACGNCSPDFNVQYCLSCGKAIANQAVYCDDCMSGKRYAFSKARAPFVYGGSVADVVKRLKYGGGKFLAPYMAQYMADAYYQSDFHSDVVTFAPMNAKKQKMRSFNQAELLARALAEIIGVPCVKLLSRAEQTENLAKMNRRQRADAVKGAIGLLPEAADADIKGKNILFVDDVMTTSATADECCRTLAKLKPADVCVLTFATSRVKPFLY